MAQPFAMAETAEVVGKGGVRITAYGGAGVNHERVKDDQGHESLPWLAAGGARVRVGVAEAHEIGGEVHALWSDGSSKPALLGAKLAWKYSLLSSLALVVGAGANIPIASNEHLFGGPDAALILSHRFTDLSVYGGARLGLNWSSGGSGTAVGLVPAVGLTYDLVGPLALVVEFGVPAWWTAGNAVDSALWAFYGGAGLTLRIKP